MKTFGLIGYPLSHSFSKKFFTEKFAKEGIRDSVYELFPIAEAKEWRSLLEEYPNLQGLNVTIPHKIAVMRDLPELDEAAAAIGAVNCIHIRREGQGHLQLKGYNTDAFGFEESLSPLLKEHHQSALIFGDGGAAKAVKYVLEKRGMTYQSVVRKPTPGTLTYEALTEELLMSHSVLINTTPLGMSPAEDTFPPIPYQAIGKNHLAYDLVYNPEKTRFLALAEERGATVKNGLDMLILQAERSWEIWNQ